MTHRPPSPAGCCIFGSSRWLVQSEDGWEHHVQQLPHELGVAFHTHCDLGRAALDLDDWALAIYDYEICRRMLLSRYLVVGEDHSGRGGEKVRDPKGAYVKKETHDWLLAWVNLPLALLYQYRAKRLDHAYGIWEDILRRVRPLQASEMRLVNVVESFVCTSLYDWACSDNTPKHAKAKVTAVKYHARLNSWDEREAEPHLCLLLCFDHYYFGSWQVGLEWIQRAKRLWEQNLPERKEYDHIFLRYEAELLTKLLMFREAEALLKNWLKTRDLERSRWHAAKVHHLLYECYTDWSCWAAEYGPEPDGTPKGYEQSAKRSRRMAIDGMIEDVAKESLPFEEQYNILGLKFESCRGNFLLSEESRRRLSLPSTFRCSSDVSRGLTSFSRILSQEASLACPTSPEKGHTESVVQKINIHEKVAALLSSLDMGPISIQLESGLDHHLQKLPLELGVAFCIHADYGRAALEEGDWKEAIVQYQMCRQMLKLTKRAVEIETHDWLLAWIDLPLARLYQYRAKNFNKAFQMRREILDCVRLPNSNWRLENCITRGKSSEAWLTLNYPGVSERYTHVDGCIHKNFSEEKITRMLDWIKPSFTSDCQGERKVLRGSSDPEYDEAYSIRRRRSNRICRVQWNKSLEETMDRIRYWGPTYTNLENYFEILCCIALYEWACAEYPGMKDETVTRYSELGGCAVPDEEGAETQMCMFLSSEYSSIGNMEANLHWIQEAKRSLQKNLPGTWKSYYEVEIILAWEIRTLMKLSRLEEANLVLKNDLKEANWEPDWELCELGTSRQDFLRRRIQLIHFLEVQLNAGFSKKAAEVGNLETAQEFLKAAKRVEGGEVVPNLEDGEVVSNLFQNLSVMVEELREVMPLAWGDVTQKCRTAIEYLNLRSTDEHCNEIWRLMQESDQYLQAYQQSLSVAGQPNPEDENFARTVQTFEKLREIMYRDLSPLEQAWMNHKLAKLYEEHQLHQLHYLLRQLEETNLGLHEQMVIATPHHQQAGSSTPRAEKVQTLNVDVKACLARTRPMVEYGRQALLQYADLLYQMTDQSTDTWIGILEKHKDLYHLLERYYYRNYLIDFSFHKLMGTDPELTREDRDKSIASAFLWSERQRARVMLYQAGPNKLRSLAAAELRAFDTDDDFAMEALDMEGTTFEKGTVFVEYSYASQMELCRTFVRDQDGKLSIDDLHDLRIDELQQRLKNLLTHLNRRENANKASSQPDELSSSLYDDNHMHKDLEYFYDHLIKPIAHHLKPMKPEDKLIFAPNELLNKVPFAALRDSTKPPGHGYLIQSHTISLTPSLRVLKKCHDRLQALHKLPLHPGPGSIVALGDPAYGNLHTRKLIPLESTGDEVQCIEALFGEARVVKLLGTRATAESLLQWARKLSGDGKPSKFRQAFFHIGAHGYADWNLRSKGVLYLAKLAKAKVAVTSRDHTNISRGFSEFAEEDERDPDEVEEEDDDSPHPSAVAESEAASDSEIFRSSSSSTTTTKLRKTGELNADEISGCKFDWTTEMVILSACDTAIGEISAEGVLSLARAFMIAGAPCIVASQWKVMDKSTSVLMEGFYRNLKSGKDVASALRTSMLAMIEQVKPKPMIEQPKPEPTVEQGKPEPANEVSHWAPFIVWGLPTVCLPAALQDA